MADLAYLPFKDSDKGSTINEVFKNRPIILQDTNCNGETDEKEKKEWEHILHEMMTSKNNTYYGNDFLNDWKVYAVEEQNQVAGGTGFFGVAFQNTNTEEVVFAFRGTEGVLMSITPKNRVSLKTYPLEDIDEMRDLILQTRGNTTLYVNEEQSEYDLPLYRSFGERLPTGKLNTTSSR